MGVRDNVLACTNVYVYDIYLNSHSHIHNGFNHVDVYRNSLNRTNFGEVIVIKKKGNAYL